MSATNSPLVRQSVDKSYSMNTLPSGKTRSRRPNPFARRETSSRQQRLAERIELQESQAAQANSTGLNKIVKADRKDKGRAIIAVVAPESLWELERKCRPSKWKFWQDNDLVRITTVEGLQDAIEELQDDKRSKHLTLLVGDKVEEITVHVHGRVGALSVFRCDEGTQRIRGSGEEDDGSSSNLLVTGQSTFRGARLDEWQGKRHKHGVYLGDGVGVKIGLSEGSPWAGYSETLSELEKTEIYQHFKRLHEEDPHAQDKWWVKWQAPIASILGLVTGNQEMEAAFKATADGIYVGYRFGAAAVGAVASSGVVSSSVISAAGPAALLGVGAAAAAYFIPWDGVFKWLQGVFKRLFTQLLSMWKRLMEWVAQKLGDTIGGIQTRAPKKTGPPVSHANQTLKLKRVKTQ